MQSIFLDVYFNNFYDYKWESPCFIILFQLYLYYQQNVILTFLRFSFEYSIDKKTSFYFIQIIITITSVF